MTEPRRLAAHLAQAPRWRGPVGSLAHPSPTSLLRLAVAWGRGQQSILDLSLSTRPRGGVGSKSV